jgi:hypothetical protein
MKETTSMATNTLPIVGAFHHPPAKALIEALPIGTPLTLIAEPDNAFDVNAIMVWLKSTDIPEAAYPMLEESLPAFGHSLDTVTNQESWHIGYIPKEMAAKLRAQGVAEQPLEVSFSTSTNGAPRVRSEEPFDI